MATGLYHYDPIDHYLTFLEPGDPIAAASEIAGTPIGSPNVFIYLTAVLHRTCVKYGGRGYRYALIEAGALAQSLCLVASSLGLGSYLIGGFDDARAADYLDVSGELELEYPILLIAIGAPSTA
jgi:SagB-type dehydrogenase family enzyme